MILEDLVSNEKSQLEQQGKISQVFYEESQNKK